MENSLKNFIRFEDTVWFVDFSDAKAGFEIKIVEPDGSRREALKSDGDLMEVLELGIIIPDPTTSEDWFPSLAPTPFGGLIFPISSPEEPLTGSDNPTTSDIESWDSTRLS